MTSVMPDNVLALAALLAPDSAGATLSDALGTDVGPVAAIEVLEHKPGRRALVRFDTTSAGTLYGKVFPDSESAERTHDLMARISGAVPAPRPVGLVPSRARVVSEPLLGPSLDAHVGTEALLTGLQGAGRWLANLHAADLDLPRVLDVDHEAANATTWSTTVTAAFPDLAESATRLAGLLGDTVPAPVSAPVPIHKDFHYQHVITGDRVGVVDVDEARMGDPLFDVGHFLANLALLARRNEVSATERDRWDAAFRQDGWNDDARLRWYVAYTCVKVAKQLANGQGPRPRPEGEFRREQAGWALDHGLGMLA